MNIQAKIDNFRQILDRVILDDGVNFDRLLLACLHYLRNIGLTEGEDVRFTEGLFTADEDLANNMPLENVDAVLHSLGTKQSLHASITYAIPTPCGKFDLNLWPTQTEAAPLLNVLLDIFRDKVSIAFQFKEERAIDIAIQQLVKLQLESDLQPGKAWKAIAKQALDLLPNFLPFIDRTVGARCQVLTWRRGSRFLTLRADSTETNAPDGNLIGGIPLLDTKKVVSGLVILNNIDSFLTNPKIEYATLYGAFLFPDEEVQSEAVIALRDGSDNVAILNFEHPRPLVFSGYVFERMKRTAALISPFAHALINREERIRDKDKGKIYIITSMLERLNGDLTHRVNNAVQKAMLLCEAISNSTLNSESARGFANSAKEQVEIIFERSKGFLSDVPNYLKAGAYVLRPMLNHAVENARIELRDTTYLKSAYERFPIIIEVFGDQDERVFASLLFRENLKNLIVNSGHAVLEKALRTFDHVPPKDYVPRITIAVESKSHGDLNDRNDISPVRIYVTITDNGVGVPPSKLASIRNYGETCRKELGGTGFGFSAAIDYVQSVFGGDFQYDNLDTGGFRVRFYLLAYTSQIDDDAKFYS